MDSYSRRQQPATGLGRWLMIMLLFAAPLSWPARAAATEEPVFYGTWLITGAQVAPWAKAGEEDSFSRAEQRRLIGSKVIYRKLRIEAPLPLACEKPRYQLHAVPPDFLFQGGLNEPVPQAQALGFHLSTIMTLETGCEGEFDFHFIDARTAMFGLNNMIYTLRKQPDRP